MSPRIVGLHLVFTLSLIAVFVVALPVASAEDALAGQEPKLIVPGVSLAQAEKLPRAEPSPVKKAEAVSREEFNTAISRIEERLEAISESLSKVANTQQSPPLPPLPSEQPADQPQPTLAPDKQTEPAEQAQAADQERPTQAEFEALRDRVFDQEVILADLAKRIAQPEGPGRYIVDIRGNLQNPTFRQELAEAVTEVLPRQGTLHIRNTMTTEQTLRVNNQEYRIPAGSSLEVTVPVGTVTTELVGYEEPRNWAIAPPTYEERLVIGPQSARRAYYAPSDTTDAVRTQVYTSYTVADPVDTACYVVESPACPTPCPEADQGYTTSYVTETPAAYTTTSSVESPACACY